ADRRGTSRQFTVSVTNRARGPAVASVRLTLPRGWAAGAVPSESLAFLREDEAKNVTFTVSLPAGVGPGVYELGAAAIGGGPDGGTSEGALVVIAYPHIRPRPVVHPSTAQIPVARIALAAPAPACDVLGAAGRVAHGLA